MGDELADDTVGIPEGNAFTDQIIRTVGSIGEAAGSAALHDIRAERHRTEHSCEDSQAFDKRIAGIEEGFLILLHILIIREGNALHHCQERHQITIHPAGFATDELGDIGVLLLGHDGRAGGKAIIHLDEAELIGIPEDQLLTEAGEMHHGDGRGGKIFQEEIPIRDAVETVFGNRVEIEQFRDPGTIEWVGGAGQGPGAQGHHICGIEGMGKAAAIPEEHLDIGHKMMGEGNGLSFLEMGIAGHDGMQVLSGDLQKHFNEGFQKVTGFSAGSAGIHAGIEGDLVVPGPAGMEALAGFADALNQEGFHIHMDVLGFRLPGDFAGFRIREDGFQAFDDLFSVFFGDDVLLAKHGGMSDGAGDILLVETLVEGDAGMEIVNEGVGGFFETAGP